MRILDFNQFSALFEAEELQGQTASTLRRIINSFFMSYGSLSALTDGYDKMLSDLDAIKKAEISDKLEKMKDASKGVSDKVLQDFKAKGVDSEWKKAADKFTEALAALIAQYSDNEETTNAIGEKIDSMIEEYKEDLIKSKREAEAAQQKAEANESEITEGDKLFEGWFTGKKGNIRNLTSQAVALKAQLEGQKESEGLQNIVGELLKEVSDIILNLSELSTLKRKDIEETKLQEIGNRLNEIPLEVSKKEEKLAKSNTANKEASAIYIQGLDIAENAFKLESEVKEELAKKAEEEAAKKEEEEKAAKKIKLSGDLDPEKISGRRRNSEVAKFQEAVIDKFKDYKPFEDFDLLQKFLKYGDDGFFGKTTKAMVKSLKAGFELEDNSDVITQELMDKIVYEPLNENNSNLKFLNGFDSFNESNILEAFDPEKAKRIAPKPSAPNAPKAEDSKEDVEDDEETPVATTDATYTTVDAIVNEIEDLLKKANEEIVDLYDDTTYWKEYKGTFNDNEDEAVKDVFGENYESKTSWWYKKVRRPYVIKAEDLLAYSYPGLKDSDSDAWDHLKDEITEFETTYKRLKEKTLGDTGLDTYKWSLKLYKGGKETYQVDTDF
jgi:hypothetical protein